jgi:hypothetical protein
LTSGERLPWGALICLGGFVLLVAWPALVSVKRYGLGVVLMPAMAAYLMIVIPPWLWLRERLKGRRAARRLILFLVGSPLLALYYIPSELGRYVVRSLRGAA